MTTAPETTKPAAPPAADLVTLTIDDRQVSVAKGTLICLERLPEWRSTLESSDDDV